MDCKWQILSAFKDTHALRVLKQLENYLAPNSPAKRYLANLVESVALPILAAVEIIIMTTLAILSLASHIHEGRRAVKRLLTVWLSPIGLLVATPFFLIANIFGANYLPINFKGAHFNACKAAVEEYRVALNKGKKPNFQRLRSMCQQASNFSNYGNSQSASIVILLIMIIKEDGDPNQLKKLVDILLGDRPAEALLFMVSEPNVSSCWMDHLLVSINRGNPFKLDLNALYSGRSLTTIILQHLFETVRSQKGLSPIAGERFAMIVEGLFSNGLIVKKEDLDKCQTLTLTPDQWLQLFETQSVWLYSLRGQISFFERRQGLSVLLEQLAIRDGYIGYKHYIKDHCRGDEYNDDYKKEDGNSLNYILRQSLAYLIPPRGVRPGAMQVLPAFLELLDWNQLERLKRGIISGLGSIVESGDPHFYRYPENSAMCFFLIYNVVKCTNDFRFVKQLLQIEEDKLPKRVTPSRLSTFLKKELSDFQIKKSEEMSGLQSILEPRFPRVLTTFVGDYIYLD